MSFQREISWIKERGADKEVCKSIKFNTKILAEGWNEQKCWLQ